MRRPYRALTSMKKYFLIFAVTFLAATPAYGQGIDQTYLKSYTDAIVGIINALLLPIVISIAFIVFIWGVYRYFILGSADEKKREEGRKFVLWGIVGFVIIFSVWGLVNIVGSTLGLRPGGGSPPTPTINTCSTKSGSESAPVYTGGSTWTNGTEQCTEDAAGNVDCSPKSSSGQKPSQPLEPGQVAI